MKFRQFVLAGVIFLAAGFTLLLAQSTPPKGPPIHSLKKDLPPWKGKREVAVFPTASTSLTSLKKALKSYDSQGVIEEEGSNYLLFRLSSLSASSLAQQAATIESFTEVDRVLPVYYRHPRRHLSDRVIPTGSIILSFQDQVSTRKIRNWEKAWGLTSSRSLAHLSRIRIYRAPDPWRAEDFARKLSQSPLVKYAYPDSLSTMKSRAVPTDPRYGNQWHLENTGQGGGTPGEDIASGQMETVWDSYRGSTDEVIAIIDDGVEINHEDLKDNIITGRSFDYFEGDTDPTGGDHGTSSAGSAAARGFNATGVASPAPEAGLIGYRLIGGAETFSNQADAFNRNLDIVDVYSNSWGPPDNGNELFDPGPLVHEAFERGVNQGRDGKGAIYIWAGGNGGDNNDNSNYDGYANSPYTIAVGSSDNNGEAPDYSEPGANILLVAPSKASGKLGIVTTDRTGSDGFSSNNYFSNFSGTSASTSITAGCVALILQANPNLTWRDVQHILIETAAMNDATHPDWTTNGAGKNINHQYGFGRINVKAATDLAPTWTLVGPRKFIIIDDFTKVDIPDNNSTGVTRSLTVNANLTIEHVEVIFSAPDHPRWTDLQVEVISPDGTRSILAETHSPSTTIGSYADWRFLTLRHWGESSQGTWQLVVKDQRSGKVGKIDSWTLRIYGTGSDNSLLVERFEESGSGGCALSPRPDGFSFFPLLVLLGGLVLLRRKGGA